MDNKLFREKSLKKLSSPDNLNEYLRVTTPSMWIILTGTAIVLIGLFIWSNFMTINSYVYGDGVVKDGILTVTYEEVSSSSYVKDDMDVMIGGIRIPIDTVTKDSAGNIVSLSHTDFPDGEYAARASYRQTRLISMLFN